MDAVSYNLYPTHAKLFMTTLCCCWAARGPIAAGCGPSPGGCAPAILDPLLPVGRCCVSGLQVTSLLGRKVPEVGHIWV